MVNISRMLLSWKPTMRRKLKVSSCQLEHHSVTSHLQLSVLNSLGDLCPYLDTRGVFRDFHHEGVLLGSWHIIISPRKILQRNWFSYFWPLKKYSSRKSTILITIPESTLILKIDLEARLNSINLNSVLEISNLVFIFGWHVSNVL